MLFQTGLFLHMIGILFIAGGSIGSVVTESVFWKSVRLGSDKARAIAPLLIKFPPVIIGGALLMLISGVLMLYTVNWVFWGQTWFMIKLLLFVALVLNGRISGRPTYMKLVQEVQLTDPSSTKLKQLKSKIQLFHIIQFTMLTTLIALVIFKP